MKSSSQSTDRAMYSYSMSHDCVLGGNRNGSINPSNPHFYFPQPVYSLPQNEISTAYPKFYYLRYKDYNNS